MNRTGDNTAPPKAHRCTRQPNSQEETHGGGLKKNRNPPTAQASDVQRCTKTKTVGPPGTMATRCVKDRKAETGKRLGKSAVVTTDGQKHQSAQRKLSDASNASEDFSKDSGCMSGKVSCSDSSSEISDCTSEGNKISSDPELSGSGGGALCTTLDTSSGNPFTRVPDMKNEGIPSTCTWQENAIYSGGEGCNSSGCCGDSLASLPSLDVSVAGYSDLTEELFGETPEDLVREADDLRSENEYLKDELEELHCEMLEMRDMFMEEEVYQLQDLRLQLDQANKMCRILQYRLRKAERRSIRVAQTGQVDGELVRTLEHDMKVAKSVSARLHNELESVMQRNSQLLWENEALRERLQDLEVSKQVLQVELEKARESSLKRRSVRSPTNKTEKKHSYQDDSADLRCQLHFAKEESALMCKKLTKLAFECEKMHEDLTRYRSTYGDIGTSQSSEGSCSSPFAREADVKVHLRLVEEEATLLSRRIVELEVENRGLRAEMSDLRERGGGGEEQEEQQEGVGEHLALSAQGCDREKKNHELRRGYKQFHDGECKQNEGVVLECSQANMEFHFSNKNQSQVERMFDQSQITREGPVGGEQDSLESDSDKQGRMVASGFSGKDLEAFFDLRDHACLMCSALQLLTTPVNNCSALLSHYLPRLDTDPKAQVQGLDLPQQETLFGVLELLQSMLMAFIGKMESLISSGSVEKEPSHQPVNRGWDSNAVTVLSGASALNYEDTKNLSASPEKETVENLSTAEVMGKEEEAKQEPGPLSQWNHLNTCRDPVVRLTLQMLWVLHQRCGGNKNSSLEKKEVRDTAMRLLQGVLFELRSELQEDNLTEQDNMAAQSEMAQSAVHTILDDKSSFTYERTYPKGKKYRHNFCAFRSTLKNRCYLSVDSAQLDPGDQFKTWDHPIMPLSFPDLDVDQMIIERSHTAPEKTSLCIYYSPPSARRVQLAQLKKSPILGKTSPTTVSPCHKAPSSVPRCLRLSANLSDDMKEMTASFQAVRQAVRRSSSLERRKGRLCEEWVIDVASASTQTLIKQPQMVSVGLQTDGSHSVGGVRACSSRLRSSSMVSSKSLHLSSSLERIPSRTKPGSISPKFYCRPSSSSPSSPSSFLSSTSSSSHSSSSTSTLSKDQGPLSPSQRASVRSSWGRPTSTRSGQGLNSTTLISDGSKAGNHSKPPSKPAGTNRYGLVTEFLRRVSGRADKPASGTGQKAKSGLKNLERLPSTRPPAGPLHRNDSITRIVNQRFMKQREEAGRIQKEEKGQNTNQGVKGFIHKDQNTITREDGNYECNSKTLTFCFARPPRTTQHQVRLPHHGYSAAGTESGDPICEEGGKRRGSGMDS